jgi:hypothetical protein
VYRDKVAAVVSTPRRVALQVLSLYRIGRPSVGRMPLLNDVCQFVREQFPAPLGVGPIGTALEHDVVAMGERLGVD